MFGAYGRATGATSLAFVSQAALASGAAGRYGLDKALVAVRGCRTVSKRDMKLNDALPKITVDAETYVVTADGEELRSQPAKVLPLAQRIFCFDMRGRDVDVPSAMLRTPAPLSNVG